MVQEAIVSRILNDEMAEVFVVRISACGKSCTSCEGCSLQNKLVVNAINSFSSAVGQKVLIESRTSKIFAAAFVVYLLPMLTMIFASIIMAYRGASELTCVLAAFIGLSVGILITLLIHHFIKNKKAIEYTIIKELN